MTKAAGSRRLLVGVIAACVALTLLVQLRDAADTPPAPGEDAAPPSTSSPTARQSRAPTAAAQDTTPSSSAASLKLALADTPPPEEEYSRMLSELNHSDKQAALVLAEKGEQWYAPVGRLAEARRAMRITLLVDLARIAEARALTREFVERYPESPYRGLVQGVTGIHPRPSGPRPTASRP